MTSAPCPFAMLSHRGNVRKGNEDACGARPEHGAYVVCDGMGGAAAGEVASRLTVDAFLDSLAATASELGPRTRLEQAVYVANRVVFQQAQRSRHLRGMGTTLVALLCEQAGPDSAPLLWLTHVGDSRCYLMRDGELFRLTEDHSLVEEQVRAGLISREQAGYSPIRNIITRAMGSHPEVQPEIAAHALVPGDLYLLASDGLTREMEEAEVGDILAYAAAQIAALPDAGGLEPILHTTCSSLVDAANASGGGDNITVLILRPA
jgi:serine/threonine protein phosphatase PrpC